MAGHAPEPRPRPGSDARVVMGHTQSAQLRIPSPPVLPLSPDIHAQSATYPGVEVVQHDRRLAEAEVASPADQVSRQGRDQLRHTDTERPTGEFPGPLLELLQGLRGDLPGRLGVVRDRESQEAHPVFRGDGLRSNPTSDPRRALPRLLTLCTNSKDPRYSGNL